METKALFFDIDGTLVNQKGVFLDSAKRALKRARANGHKLLLSTGRNFAQIYPQLIDFGFDGYVCAAGAYVKCDGNLIYHETMKEEELKPLTDFFLAHDIMVGLQVEDGSYVTPRGLKQIREGFKKLGISRGNMDSVLGGVHVVDNFDRVKGVEKLFYNWADVTVDELADQTSDYFSVLPASFADVMDQYSGEITIRGITKARGMERALAYYGIDRENSVGFGDAFNDLEMMEYAGIGVAMGNARDEVKEVADYVTDHIDRDGIAKAVEKLGLA